jgi:hypothetical protein
VLLERKDEDMEVLSRDPDNRFAVGATYGDTPLGGMLAERLTGLNRHSCTSTPSTRSSTL